MTEMTTVKLALLPLIDPGADPGERLGTRLAGNPSPVVRSCISVRLGISTCQQQETVVSWQTAELSCLPTPRCSSVPVILHPLWLLSEDQTLLVALGLAEFNSMIVQREEQAMWGGIVS